MRELNVIDSLSIANSVLPDLIKLAQVKQKLAGFWYQVTYRPNGWTEPGYVAKIADSDEQKWATEGDTKPTEAEALEDALKKWKAAQ